MVTAVQACPEAVARLLQLLTIPDDDDTQLAALEALRHLCKVDYSGRNEPPLQLANQPGVCDTLVRLMQEGNATLEAAAVACVLAATECREACSGPWGPSLTSPSSWPVMSALVAVLQSTAALVLAKADAAWAMSSLVDMFPGAAEVHPVTQAAIKPLVALLVHEDKQVRYGAAWAAETLAECCPINQSLVGAEPGTIGRLWQVAKKFTSTMIGFASLIRGHSIYQSQLMDQDSFMEDLLELLVDEKIVQSCVIDLLSVLEDNPDFVLRLCNTPSAVPTLTAALNPDSESQSTNRQHLALLLAMLKRQPSTIPTISQQPGVLKTLQQLSAARTVDEFDGATKQQYPDASSLLQLVQQLA